MGQAVIVDNQNHQKRSCGQLLDQRLVLPTGVSLQKSGAPLSRLGECYAEFARKPSAGAGVLARNTVPVSVSARLGDAV